MIIPARFRDELGNRFVVTRGLDGCLRTYTMAQWDAVFEQLKRLPSTKRETRMYIHMLTSKASECELDSQGRILLPAALITESGIEKRMRRGRGCRSRGNLGQGTLGQLL